MVYWDPMSSTTWMSSEIYSVRSFYTFQKRRQTYQHCPRPPTCLYIHIHILTQNHIETQTNWVVPNQYLGINGKIAAKHQHTLKKRYSKVISDWKYYMHNNSTNLNNVAVWEEGNNIFNSKQWWQNLKVQSIMQVW